jgi:hypothetical protein
MCGLFFLGNHGGDNFMFCITKGPLAWIKIAKNACTSWQVALTQDGWTLENLSDYQGRWQEKTWFAFLRDPGIRHTMGVSEFLLRYNLLDILDHPTWSKAICSVLCDEHTYSVHHMIPYELIQQVNWFVIDHDYYDYENLVRRFCHQHNVALPEIKKLNKSSENVIAIRKRITEIKNQNELIYGSVMKNYLERDVFLYANATQNQVKYDHYSDIK